MPRAEAHTQQGLFPQTGLVVLLEHSQAQLEPQAAALQGDQDSPRAISP